MFGIGQASLIRVFPSVNNQFTLSPQKSQADPIDTASVMWQPR